MTGVLWAVNGDHPKDRVGNTETDPGTGEPYIRQEGAVVRYYRHPDVDGSLVHRDLPGTDKNHCGAVMNEHGWIDHGAFGFTVCPGDMVVETPRGYIALDPFTYGALFPEEMGVEGEV